MATRSRGSSIGLVYGLVVFVILFVVCLALTILFYAKYTKAEKSLADAETLNKAIASRAEQSSEDFGILQDTQRGGGPTVFGQLLADVRSLKRLTVGNEQMPIADVEKALGAVDINSARNAVGAVTALNAEVEAAKQTIAQLQADAKASLDKYTTIKNQYDQLAATHTAEMAKRTDEVQAITSEVADLKQKQDQAFTQQVATHDAARTQLEKQISDLNATIELKDGEIATLQARIKRLEALTMKQKGPQMEYEGDGRVTAVVPRENVAYVNLGRNDRLILGMRFEVFDAAKGIVLEEKQGPGAPVDIRGKATLEVVQMTEKTATCRIVRQAYGAQVVAGDLITNIVYDKTRTFKFFVFGSFDLDDDNQTTIAEFDQVLSMIRQWGGVVVDDQESLPLDTDFLVLGQQPEMPRPLSPDVIDPILIGEHQRKVRAVQEYNRLASQAASLSIPVLNQNRFLTLVGYFNR